MISQRTFNAIQQIVAGRSRSVPHLSIRTEFPLRTFVRCINCEATLTGSFSRGRSARYPYYHCFRRNCDNGRSYPLADVHREFEAFLLENSANSHTLDHLKQAVRRIGEAAVSSQNLTQERRLDELKRTKEQFGQLLQLKMESLLTDEEFRTQRAILSSRIAELEGEIGGRIPEVDSVVSELDALRTQLGNLASLWQSLGIENRKRFQLLTLPRGYVFGRIGTAQKGRLFSFIGASETPDTNLVHLTCESWHQLAEEIRALAVISQSV
jgi:hypothetical protein